MKIKHTLICIRQLALIVLMTIALSVSVHADPYPPYWNGGLGPAIHILPIPWPTGAESVFSWSATTHGGYNDNDPRTSDPSNGGTRPQNYVNVSSSCIDTNEPSIYWAFDSSNQVIYFRWRVEQIANTYGTGPSPGSFSSTDPWGAALWTVFIDIDGDGFREYAMHLDGSSGDPSHQIDILAAIYSDTSSQSLDYENDPSIHRLGHNPTAFVDFGTNRILNFHNNFTPDINWPNGSSEIYWDYGTTRSINISTASCNEYWVDYQIPLCMLNGCTVGAQICNGYPVCSQNAQGVYLNPKGGKAITPDTPISMFFATANSLNNPVQKDAVVRGDCAFLTNTDSELPFGDFITLSGEKIFYPVVEAGIVTGCPAFLSTSIIKDAMFSNCGTPSYVSPSITSVSYYAYYDKNGDGNLNDGSDWQWVADGQRVGLSKWTASWSSNSLLQGQYLIGIQATDDLTKSIDGKTHRTFAYLDDTEVLALRSLCDTGTCNADCPYPTLCANIATETWHANPDPDPGVQLTPFLNNCGVTPPNITKSVDPTTQSIGGLVKFTIEIENTLTVALTVNSITDTLPAGFSWVSNDDSGASPPDIVDTLPASSISGNDVTWTLGASIPAGASRTLKFNASVAGTTGTYTNNSSANVTYTYLGTIYNPTIIADPVQIGVGAAKLNITKTANVSSADPGDTITYTITYSNDSPVNVTNVEITDSLPYGLTYTANSATGQTTGVPFAINATSSPISEISYTAPVNESTPGTIKWDVGDLASSEGPYKITFSALVTTPYPSTADVNAVNTATIDDTNVPSQVDPATSSATTFINAPRPNLVIEKDVNPIQVSAGGAITFTIRYSNTGNVNATAAYIADTLPTGVTFVSATVNGVAVTPRADSAGQVYKFNVNSSNIGTTPNNDVPPPANAIVTAGQSGTLVIQVTEATLNPNPGTNSAKIYADGITPVTATAQVGRTVSGGGGSNCATPNSCNDTSDSSCTVSLVQTNDNNEDTYTQPTTAFNEASYQEFNFASFGITTDPSAVTLTFRYAEKKTVGIKLDILKQDSTLIYNDYPITAHGTNNKTYYTVTPDIDLKALGVDTVAEANSLRIRLFAYTNGTGDGFGADYLYVCVTTPTPPANLVMDKQVNLQSAVPGDTITYTINFTNIGGTMATSSQITDTLPSGLSGISAMLNGAATTPVSTNPHVYNVNTPSEASGQINFGETGTLVISGMVTKPTCVTPVTSPFVNTARLDYSGDTDPPEEEDSASTVIKQPLITITKSADKTLLIPGDAANNIVTYKLTLVNTGDADATNVTVTDTLPVETYFTYELDSVSLNSVNIDPDPVAAGVLSYTLPTSLASGASATLEFKMKVADSGAPDGVTEISNSASVGYDQISDSCTSNTVTVSITTNPKLSVTKTCPTPKLPGDVFTYTITVNNTGSGAAINVKITDTLSTYVQYQTGTLELDGVSVADSYDPGTRKLTYTIPSLAALTGTATLTFDVKVLGTMPDGNTDVINTVNVVADNAAERNTSCTTVVSAAPILTLDKSGASTIGYPSATADFTSLNSTSFRVSDAIQFETGQYVKVGSQYARITGISGNIITVDTPITVYTDDPIYGSINYTLYYKNIGNADATNPVITDAVPAGTTFYDVIEGATDVCAIPAVGATVGTVTCNIRQNEVNPEDQKLHPGDSGSIKMIVFPNAAGTITNTGILKCCADAYSANDSVITLAGGLVISKRTTTPVVYQTASGTEAIYIIEIKNTLPSVVSNVIVTDTMVSGFTYDSIVSVTGYSGGAPANPPAGVQVAVWNSFTIPVSGTLRIEFKAKIASNVGSATYQNFVEVSSSGVGIVQFDSLATTAEDVKVMQPYIRITPDRSGQATPGTWIQYEHTINNMGPATNVCFSFASSKGWDWAIYDSLDNLLTSGATHNSLSIAANGTAEITIRYFVPTYVPAGTVDGTNILLQLYENGVCETGAYYDSVTDTTVIGSADLKLTKQVRKCNKGVNCCDTVNITTCDAFGENNTADPCDYLEYKIIFKNLSTIPYYGLTIADVIPNHTEFVPNIYNTKVTEDVLVYKPNGTTIYKDVTLSSGTLQVDLSADINPLDPGAEGYIQYKVRIIGDVTCP